MQCSIVVHCQSVRWRTGRRAFDVSQCTLTHRTQRHLRLRYHRAECRLLDRAAVADNRHHPHDSVPLPEDSP